MYRWTSTAMWIVYSAFYGATDHRANNNGHSYGVSLGGQAAAVFYTFFLNL